ncbi:MAG: DUF2442 domain-containing protein [Chloroflexota bacterium]|nr:DUF2442 domain-containing protein [Chloroflexota bacterium]MDE2854883.1 DUF2442 domain-containing protein [Chloroflexota bacterium]MDE2947461.1 DUF2442 domain-containing protein [Chloroflexota bacterium]
MTEHSNLDLKPVIHDTRNEPQGLSFTDSHVMVELADGRIIGVPLHFFPLLKAASDEERRNFKLGACDVYWEDIDDGIDLTAMLSGLYLDTKIEHRAYLNKLIADRHATTT